eukprot:CAMPEP_0197599684 /NCGR_PEP_ID=MMETSP1326-20131121/31884_1 /TAXON_ID=1155430 /ORGANISM="Genus nov. species nov., Strain RCC2288" /LENGTH=56 /DNA_ID=CAMNT_0043166693 /DNA_START=96 /DNA_END=262 /DNA_ORIENTATION=+
MAASAAELALAELAACAPGELSRVVRLREIHARCAAAGVLDTGGSFAGAGGGSFAA